MVNNNPMIRVFKNDRDKLKRIAKRRGVSIAVIIKGLLKNAR